MNQVLDKAFVKLLARRLLQVDSRHTNSDGQPRRMRQATGCYIDLFNDYFYPTSVNLLQNMLINLQKCGEKHGQLQST